MISLTPSNGFLFLIDSSRVRINCFTISLHCIGEPSFCEMEAFVTISTSFRMFRAWPTMMLSAIKSMSSLY